MPALPPLAWVPWGCVLTLVSSVPPEASATRADEVVKRAAEKDLPGAIKCIEALTPFEAARTAHDAIIKLYWDNKDLSSVEAIAMSAIARGLKAADETKTRDPEAAAKLLGVVKAVAYNLASFTWAGWDEPGITLSATDAAQGLEAARLNLRLAKELKRDDHAMGQAHWLLGAHLLVQEDDAQAAKAFAESAKRAASATQRGEELLSQGYLALTALLHNPGDANAQRDLGRIQAELLKTDDGQDLVEQLNTALRALARLRTPKTP